MIKTAKIVVAAFLFRTVGTTIAVVLFAAAWCPAQQLTNKSLSVTVNRQDGSYQFGPIGSPAILHAGVGALINHRWLRSSSYPSHSVSASPFSDALGAGQQLTVTCSGLAGSPDLIYVVQLYTENSYGTIQVRVRNATNSAMSVQAIRNVDATGDSIINLGGLPSDERVLSDSFSEDWPELMIYDFGNVPGGMHRGVGSQLIYNRQTKQSIFFGALTSDRFLTLLRLKTQGKGTEAKVASYTVDSPGLPRFRRTTARQDPEGKVTGERPDRTQSPAQSGRRDEFGTSNVSAGPDYLGQLRAYGPQFDGCITRGFRARSPWDGGAGRLIMPRSTRAKRWSTPTGCLSI